MIECTHKNVMVVINMGLITEFCIKHGRFVNDTICGQCSDREGGFDHPPMEAEFPRRSDEEIKSVHNVCKSCPLFKVHEQTCSKMPYQVIPTDIWSQHPSNHCPEKQW